MCILGIFPYQHLVVFHGCIVFRCVNLLLFILLALYWYVVGVFIFYSAREYIYVVNWVFFLITA